MTECMSRPTGSRSATRPSATPTPIRHPQRGERLTGSILALVAGGGAFYAICDLDVLDRWWIWTAGLTGWAVIEAFRPRDHPVR